MNSFVSGGFIAAKQRGTKYEGLVAAWDCAASVLASPLFRLCILLCAGPAALLSVLGVCAWPRVRNFLCPGGGG
jgi:hypothetical protein